MLKLILGNPLYLLIAAAVIYAAGFGSGWGVNGWRLGSELATANGTIDTLRIANDGLVGANNRCKINVDEVKAGVKSVVDAGLKLQKQAAAEMRQVAGKAQGHLNKADEILSRPPVAEAEWCKAVISETAAYVAERRKALETKP
jgi:hypothetical protein